MALRPLLFLRPRRVVLLAAAALVALGVAACGPDSSLPGVDVAPPQISGRYEVKGVTSDPTSPDKRKISGIVILEQQGDRYSAKYELQTTWPAEGGSTDADVVGVGEGTIEGATLKGTAQTQVVISSVPGVDAGFAFVPRMVTTRIVSDSVGTVNADGTISLEIENRAAEGEEYRSTRTRMTGHRLEGGVAPATARN